jgi:NhaP-type Na+/H+ or K+/H+ antiporter
MCSSGGICTVLLISKGLCQKNIVDDIACHTLSLPHGENRSDQEHALLQSEFRVASIPDSILASRQSSRWGGIPEDVLSDLDTPAQKPRKEIKSMVSLGRGDAIVTRVRESERRRVENLDPETPRAIMPLPVYIHMKQATSNIVSRAMENDLLGDALEPSEHGVGLKDTIDTKEHVADHGYVALLFLFSSLVIGGGVLWVLERYATGLPYTCALFLCGLLIAFLHWYLEGLIIFCFPSYHHSVVMWQTISPHLFFYVFLPALIFGEAMTLQVELAKKCIGQILLLACPGVLIGTCLTAAVGKYIMPYGWSWPVCMVLGSILSATDPVAVVALFNTLGVSPRLTMLISGESLLNDGTAMVLFILFLKVSLGATVTPSGVCVFFAQMTISAAIIGGLVGGFTVWAVGQCSEDHFESNSMIQIVATMACGYVAFFLAESEFSTSGVLATVAAGVVVSKSMWPRVVSRETLHTVWEMIEFVGNTLVFFVAGLIFGGICLSRQDHIELADYGYLLLLYLITMLIRAFMMLLLWAPLHLAGTKITYQEGTVMVWSGLRGAVGLAMAVIMDLEPGIDRALGSRVMFHVGGVAALTTLINASSCSHLLWALKLTKTPKMRKKMISHLEYSMALSVQGLFDAQIREPDGIRFAGADPDLVRQMLPVLNKHEAPLALPHADLSENEEKMQLKMYREVFLRVVETHYWDSLSNGMLPRKIKATRTLLASTNVALDMTGKTLNDWMVIEHDIVNDLAGPMHKLYSTWPLSKIKALKGLSRTNLDTRACIVVLSFLRAHSRAQEEVPQYFGRADSQMEYIWKKVNYESQQQCQLARQRLAMFPAETVVMAKSKLLASRILAFQLDEIRYYQSKGVITEGMAKTLEERVVHMSRRLQREPPRTWLSAMYGTART